MAGRGADWKESRDEAAMLDVVCSPNCTSNSSSASNTQLFFAADVRSGGVIAKSSLCSEPASSRRCGTQLGREGRCGVIRVGSKQSAYRGLLNCVLCRANHGTFRGLLSHQQLSGCRKVTTIRYRGSRLLAPIPAAGRSVGIRGCGVVAFVWLFEGQRRRRIIIVGL